MIFYPSALLQLVLLLSYRFSLGSNTHALFSTSFRLARNQNFCNLKFMLFALLSDVFPTRRGVCVCGVCILNWPVTQTHKTKREYEQQQQLKNERKKNTRSD